MGGICGIAIYNVNINRCYNAGRITSIATVGGIAGYASHTKLRYLYNKGTVNGSTAGGIAGFICDYDNQSYTNNELYYIYNIGTINGSNLSCTGSIVGSFQYYEIDYAYALSGKTSKTTYESWGYVGPFRYSASNQGVLTKADLISAIISKFGNYFKADYTGTSSINNGYPILSWE